MQNPYFKITALLCWFGWIFDFYDLIIISFLIPMIEASLHIDPKIGVWLIGVGLGASGVGGLLFGWLADLYGRKKILIVTVLMFSFGMFLTAFTQTTVQFILARFITGLGLGGEWAVGHALIGESVPVATRARWGAFLQSGEPVGVALASVVGFLVAPYIGWRNVFLISSLSALITLLFRRYLQESPVWLKAPAINHREWKLQLGPFLKQYKFIMLLAFILAVFKLGTYWTCYTWLPRFISESYGEAIGKSALWILCGQLGQFIGMFLFGYVADKIGRRVGFSIFSLVTGVVLFCLAVFWTQLFNDHTAAFWLLMFFLGLGSGCTPGFGTLLAETFPTTQRTFAMGTIYNLARGVQLFAPVIVGMAVSEYGLTGGLLVPTTLAFLTAVWVWTLPEKKPLSLKDVYLLED